MVTLLLGLAAGVGAGYLMFGGAYGGSNSTTTDAPIVNNTNTSKEQGSLAVADPAKNSAAPRESAKTTDAPTQVDSSAVDAMIKKSKVQLKEESGSGVISGVVTDTTGKPVEGVVVRLAPQYTNRDYYQARRRDNDSGVPRVLSLDETVKITVDQYQRTTGAMRQAVSAANGSYQFEGLPDQMYTVVAYSKRYEVAAEESGWYQAVKPGETVNFTAKIVTPVSLQVLAPDGQPAKEANIIASSGSESSREMRNAGDNFWTPENTKIYLRPGKYDIHAVVSDEENMFPGNEGGFIKSDSVPVEVTESENGTPVVLKLHSVPGVFGKVVFPKNDIERNGYVTIMEVAAGTEPDLKQLAKSDKGAWIGAYRSKYQFSDLKQGTYVVGVAREHRGEVVASAVVTIGETPVEQNLELPAPSAKNSLIVLATNKAGEPILCNDFEFRIEQKNRTNSGGGKGARQSNGEYWVSLSSEVAALYNKKWNAGTHLYLSVVSESLGTREVEIVEGQKNATVVFDEPATLKITVAGYKGSGMEGRLSVTGAFSGGRGYGAGHFTTKIGADGTGLSSKIQPGEYDIILNASKADSEWNTTQVAKKTFVLLPGENLLTFSTPQLYNITVRFPKGYSGSHVSLQSGEERQHFSSPEIGEDETALFENLPSGEYLLTVYHGQPEIMKVIVPTSGIIEFQPMKVNALRVRISSTNNEATKAGLQNGDLIVGVDGKEFENTQQMQMLFAAAMTKSEDSKLTILRGGNTVEVTFNLGNMRKGLTGFNLEPAGR